MRKKSNVSKAADSLQYKTLCVWIFEIILCAFQIFWPRTLDLFFLARDIICECEWIQYITVKNMVNVHDRIFPEAREWWTYNANFSLRMNKFRLPGPWVLYHVPTNLGRLILMTYSIFVVSHYIVYGRNG